jgi:hypothetical protein
VNVNGNMAATATVMVTSSSSSSSSTSSSADHDDDGRPRHSFERERGNTSNNNNLFVRLPRHLVAQLCEEALREYHYHYHDEDLPGSANTDNGSDVDTLCTYWTIAEELGLGLAQHRKNGRVGSTVAISTVTSTATPQFLPLEIMEMIVCKKKQDDNDDDKEEQDNYHYHYNEDEDEVASSAAKQKCVYGSFNGGTLTPLSDGDENEDETTTVLVEIPPSLLLLQEDDHCHFQHRGRDDGDGAKANVKNVMKVTLRALPMVKNAAAVTLEPLSTHDWELLEIYAEQLEESTLLGQVSMLYPHQILPIQIQTSIQTTSSSAVATSSSGVRTEKAWVKVVLDDHFAYANDDEDDDEGNASDCSGMARDADSDCDSDDVNIDTDCMVENDGDEGRYNGNSNSHSDDNDNEDEDDWSWGSGIGSGSRSRSRSHTSSSHHVHDLEKHKEISISSSRGDRNNYRLWEWRSKTVIVPPLPERLSKNNTNNNADEARASAPATRRRRTRRQRQKKYYKCLRLVQDTRVCIAPKPRVRGVRHVVSKNEGEDAFDSASASDQGLPWSEPLGLTTVVPTLSQLSSSQRALCDAMREFLLRKQLELQRQQQQHEQNLDTILLADRLDYKAWCLDDLLPNNRHDNDNVNDNGCGNDTVWMHPQTFTNLVSSSSSFSMEDHNHKDDDVDVISRQNRNKDRMQRPLVPSSPESISKSISIAARVRLVRARGAIMEQQATTNKADHVKVTANDFDVVAARIVLTTRCPLLLQSQHEGQVVAGVVGE